MTEGYNIAAAAFASFVGTLLTQRKRAAPRLRRFHETRRRPFRTLFGLRKFAPRQSSALDECAARHLEMRGGSV